jgi:gluconolactonase
MLKKLLLIFMSIHTYSLNAQNSKTLGSLIAFDNHFYDLIDKSETIQVLSEGYEWSEGPVWVKNGNYLLFSDVPTNTIYKWENGKNVEIFLKPSGYTGILPYSNEPGSNGLTIGLNGQLIACEHGDRRITQMPLEGKGGKFTLADTYEGKRFNSPNDVVQSKTGDIYFTDPPYGLPSYVDDPSREIDWFGVYRINKALKVSVEVKNLIRPNGVALSPDQKFLYVAQSDQKAYIMKYPINEDGSLGNGSLFFDASYLNQQGLKGAPDGLKVDENGVVFSSGPGGVLVIDVNGKLLGRIDIPAATSNLAWGEDGSTLFITSDMFLLRLKTKTKGANF